MKKKNAAAIQRAAIEQASLEQKAKQTNLRKSLFIRSLFCFQKPQLILTAKQNNSKRSHNSPCWAFSNVISSTTRSFNAVVTTLRKGVSTWISRIPDTNYRIAAYKEINIRRLFCLDACLRANCGPYKFRVCS